MEMSDKYLRAYCQTLSGYSANKLMDYIFNAENDYPATLSSRSSGYRSIMDYLLGNRSWTFTIPKWRPKGWKSKYIKVCKRVLRENSEIVKVIIRENHNDIATMVYSIGLVVGNQIIQTGQINDMTVVYTVLMYLAKKGFDKVLSNI